jgi:uncharacterized protein (DUF2147 family)
MPNSTDHAAFNYQDGFGRAMARVATGLAVAFLTVVGAMAASPQAAPQAVPAQPEAGVWLDDTGKGAVEIMPCAANRLCGRIVWLRETTDAKGRPITDGNNPDSGKRARLVCGLQVIGDLKPQKDGTWDNGWVYDPKIGQSFDVAVALRDPQHLVVTGYQGLRLFGQKFVWTRAPADSKMVRCDG